MVNPPFGLQLTDQLTCFALMSVHIFILSFTLALQPVFIKSLRNMQMPESTIQVS